jgi:hypothetical protein
MKKSVITTLVVTFTTLLLGNHASSQQLAGAYHEFSLIEKASVHSNMSTRAVGNFLKQFSDVHTESWSKKDDGYRARFNRNKIKYMVDYDPKGNWVNTIRVYDENMLPTRVRKTVKVGFLDFSIVKVIELETNKTVAYFVKIEDNISLKTVRVMDGEMDVVEDLKKR